MASKLAGVFLLLAIPPVYIVYKITSAISHLPHSKGFKEIKVPVMQTKYEQRTNQDGRSRSRKRKPLHPEQRLNYQLP